MARCCQPNFGWFGSGSSSRAGGLSDNSCHGGISRPASSSVCWHCLTERKHGNGLSSSNPAMTNLAINGCLWWGIGHPKNLAKARHSHHDVWRNLPNPQAALPATRSWPWSTRTSGGGNGLVRLDGSPDTFRQVTRQNRHHHTFHVLSIHFSVHYKCE